MSLAVFLKRYWYPLAAGALIVCAVALRLALILLGWPHGNSEEGTMGLEAMHILLRGEHPIYLYGQRYMGVGEAYAGALAYRIFGVSTVALRLGMIVCYACCMVGVCWLAGLLYSRRVALVALAALALGTPFLVKIELLADGGKAETMALGALLFALASWLALTRPPAAPDVAPASRRQRTLRAAGFVAWGVMAGFGLYTYTIIAPFVLTTGLLLWLTCRRELRGWALALPLAGLLVGLSPDILYTATTPIAANPIAVFWSLHQSLNQGGASGALLLLKQIDGTLLFTLPTVTGLASLYPVQALPLYGPPTSTTIAAFLIGGGWSLAYLALLAVATYRPLRALWPARTLRWTTWSTAHLKSDQKREMRKAALAQASQAFPPSPALAQSEARDEVGDETRHLARLLLALTAWLTIAAYMFSATAANNPNSGRYMIGLLVIVPAVLWPLLDPTPQAKHIIAAPSRLAGTAMRRNAWRFAAAALLVVSLVVGALSTAQTFPNEVAADGRDAQFIHDLLSRGVTRFYADYWTCDLLNFETRERLTCAVIDDYGRPGLTRYRPYFDTVHADPAAPYVLAHGSDIERTFLIQAAQNHQRYAVQSFDGHDIYTPIGA